MEQRCRNYLKWGFVFACSVLLAGCSFRPLFAKNTTPQRLAPLAHQDTTDHIAYMGSDEKYHYFHHSRLFSNRSYKILVSDLYLKRTFPLNHGQPYVIQRSDLITKQ